MSICPLANDTSTPVTLITGGSDGIGRALADLFAQQGTPLLLVARNRNRLRIAADELEREWHIEVHIASLDLMEQNAVSDLLQILKQKDLHVEHLVNSAAIAFMGPFCQSDITGVRSLVQLNISATTELTHQCIADMKQRGHGGVLNIASLSGFLPMPNLALYSASKSYLITLTQAIAEEIRNSDIKISVATPGPVDTSFIEHGGTEMQKFSPMLTPKSVAKVVFEGYMAGQTVITPGFLGMFYRITIKLLPQKLLLRSLSAVLNNLYTK